MANSTGAYGGDEVGAVVLDMGSHSVRAGFAGDDTPKINFPTHIGVRNAEGMIPDENGAVKKKFVLGINNITAPKENIEIENPLKSGMIENWDMFEAIIDHTFQNHLRTEINQHPILMTEPATNERNKREKLTELMFEKYNVPAFYLCKSPVLSTFASGRSTALVLDSGASHTTATPVHDGYVLQNGVIRTPLAGDFVMLQCRDLMNSLNIDVVPNYMVKSRETVSAGEPARWVKRSNLPDVTKSWHKFMVNQVLKDVSHSVFQVSDNELMEQDSNMNIQKVSA